MKKAGIKKLLTAAFLVFVSIQTVGVIVASAKEATVGYEPISLFDDRLRVTGTFDTEVKYQLHILHHKEGCHPAESHARKSHFVMERSNFSLETEWWAIQNDNIEVNLVSHLYYSYDFTGNFDAEFRNNIPARSYHQYFRTADEDIIRELYVQLIHGDWDIRIGKQQVVWGQQIGVQTLDVINPLDLRTQVIGLTEWENVRIGLWMIRVCKQTDLPGQIDLEGILIPNDFETFKMPLEGTYLGGVPGSPGFQDQLWRAMEHDTPARSGFHTAEWGFRIRGFLTAADLDWSLIFFHTRSDDPVTRNPQQFTDWITGYPGVPYGDRPHIPKNTFAYKQYNIAGFSLQRYSQYLEAVLRMEFAYTFDKYFDRKDEIVQKDVVGIGLGIDKDMKVPYLYELQGNQAMSFGLEYSIQMFPNYDKWVDYSRSHPRGDHNDQQISWSMTMHFFNDTFQPMCRGTYYASSDAGKFTVTLYYKPGAHWSYSLSYTNFWAKRCDRVPVSSMEKRDALGFKIAYIF